MDPELQTAVITIGQRGTIVVPADIRKRLGLECGSTMLLSVDGTTITLDAVPADPLERLAWAGRGLFQNDSDEFIREIRDEWR